MFAFLLAVVMTMLVVLGAVTALMGLLWMLASWQFWAVMFVFCLWGWARKTAARHRAAR